MMGDRLSPVSYTITANGHINGADVYVAFSIREFVRTRKLLLRLSSPVDQKWINNWYYFSPKKCFLLIQMWLTDDHLAPALMCHLSLSPWQRWSSLLRLGNIHDLRWTYVWVWCIMLPWRQQTYVPNIDQRRQWRRQEQARESARTDTRAPAYSHTHPEGKQDRKLSGGIRVNILLFLWEFSLRDRSLKA